MRLTRPRSAFFALALTGLLGALFAGPAAAQQPRATIEGTVVDDSTGTPLAGVHVFIATSTIGTTTDDEGRYRLEGIPFGAQRLYASSVGYEPVARDLLLRQTVTIEDFRLRPSVTELEEVVVEAEDDEAWRRRYERFVRLFIGETPNAEETEIMNPYVLDFKAGPGNFKAWASEPLQIENRALGYRVQYFLKDFETQGTVIRYDGEPLFEEMTPSSQAEAERWAEARREAFMGSFRHFALALLAGQVEEQGFQTYSRPAQQTLASNNFDTGALMGEQRFPIEAGTLIADTPAPDVKELSWQGFVEVIYLGETEDEAYLEWSNAPYRKPKYQTSWLLLMQDPAQIDYKGDTLDPYSVRLHGYLAFQRVADDVPKEYRPR